MSATSPSDSFLRADLIDRIAAGLSPDVRARYYRELMHCRSLPENDEMLRLLNIMQILTLLIQQAPEAVVAEREKLEELFALMRETLEKVIRSSQEYHAQLEQRLARFPEDIAEQIRPEAIAGAIQESLRQELVRSGVPQTGRMLQTTVDDATKAIRGFLSSTQELRESHRAAAQEVRDLSANIVKTNGQAVEAVRRATAHLSRQYQWPFYVLGCIAIVVAVFLGARYQQWLDSPAEPVERAVIPVGLPVPPAAMPDGGRETR